MADLNTTTAAPAGVSARLCGPVTTAIAAVRAKHEPHRRGFLRALAALPLIGGGVTLIGAPTAVAEPITDALLDSYDAWLEYEHRYLQWERYGKNGQRFRLNYPFVMQMNGEDRECDHIPMANGGARFHGKGEPSASTRAALVLSTVGCDWRESS